MQLYRFDPILKSTLWGGSRIAAYKGLESDRNDIGESWELSGVAGSESVVSDGPCAGLTLSELIERRGEGLVGRRVYERFGTEFPLLVKFIDARRDLSIQVHPNDELARRRHNARGKTEMWYVIDADEGARLYSGFDRPVTPDQYERSVADESIASLLRSHEVHRGDLFFLPAGRVHSIGAGVFVAEIQQTSDITYRIYDFGRLGADGKPRELHTELAREAIDYTVLPDYRTRYTPTADGVTTLIDCPCFTTSLCTAERPMRRDIGAYDSFVVLVCLDGAGGISADGGTPYPLRAGQTLLVPAEAKGLYIEPDPHIRLLTARIR